MSTNETSIPANAAEISLSQAILAPLDAIFKAQIHAGRSYINMLWQLAYPHIPVDDEGKQIKFKTAYKIDGDFYFEDADGNVLDANNKPADRVLTDAEKAANIVDMTMPYQFPVNFQAGEGANLKKFTIQVPVISMMPTVPLGIEEANIKFEMSITNVAEHKQLKSTEQKNFTGEKHEGDGYNESKRPWYLVEHPQSIRGTISDSGSSSSGSKISIEIKLTKSPMPAALEKSLTVLTQSISAVEMKPQNS